MNSKTQIRKILENVYAIDREIPDFWRGCPNIEAVDPLVKA